MSYRETLAREKRTKLTSSMAGLVAIMSEMRRNTARVGYDCLRFLMRQ